MADEQTTTWSAREADALILVAQLLAVMMDYFVEQCPGRDPHKMLVAACVGAKNWHGHELRKRE